MKPINLLQKQVSKLEKLQDIVLLLIRLILAYGFYGTAKIKWGNIDGVASWFQSLHYPFPTLNAYLAATTEALGVILLTLGLATRIISFPLIVVLIVAILTVHLGNGFEAGNNGFEIPLYYILMLLTLITYGSGKFSLDLIMLRKTKS